ncbi:MAG: VIT1/CCC1 transporter family protein [Candidatus Uhrbacteria bacterium]|nr:VIT1/CCC1 transporter family protein [Candidatus Uhrbacteria bacterium]
MQWGKFREHVALSIREVVFGLEDSLVSTLGAVTGVAVGTGDRFIIVLSGVVIVAVEVVSMAAGSYLSSKSATELLRERERQDHARVLGERVNDKETLRDFFVRKGMNKADIILALEAIGRERKLWLREAKRRDMRHLPAVGISPLFSASVMGVFYAIGGLVVLLPYLFLPVAFAIPVACFVAVVALFVVGYFKGKMTGVSAMKSAAEMIVISCVAALLGFGLGRLVPVLFGLEAVY